MRALKSDGPSISTAAGRRCSMACRTSRAQAGLWWRTPRTRTVIALLGQQVAGRVELFPVLALALSGLVLDVAADLLQVVGVVLGGGAGQRFDDVGGLARVAAQVVPAQ